MESSDIGASFVALELRRLAPTSAIGRAIRGAFDSKVNEIISLRGFDFLQPLTMSMGASISLGMHCLALTFVATTWFRKNFYDRS